MFLLPSSLSTVARATLATFPTALASHLGGSLPIMSNLALAGTRGPMTREPPRSTLSSLAARRLPLPPLAPTTALAGLRKCLASNSFVPTPCARTVRAWPSTQRLRPATFKWFSYRIFYHTQKSFACAFSLNRSVEIYKHPQRNSTPLLASVAAFSGPPCSYPRDNEKNCWNQYGFPVSFASFVLSALIFSPFRGEQRSEKKNPKKKKRISCRYDNDIPPGSVRMENIWNSTNR